MSSVYINHKEIYIVEDHVNLNNKKFVRIRRMLARKLIELIDLNREIGRMHIEYPVLKDLWNEKVSLWKTDVPEEIYSQYKDLRLAHLNVSRDINGIMETLPVTPIAGWTQYGSGGFTSDWITTDKHGRVIA